MAAPIRMSGMLCFTSSEVPNGVSGKACSGSYCTWLHQCGCYIWLDHTRGRKVERKLLDVSVLPSLKWKRGEE